MCNCRLCNKPLKTKSAENNTRHENDAIVTCMNPDCDMFEYTFSLSYYPSVNLSNYVKEKQ